MNINEEIKEIYRKIDELSETVKLLLERQNSHYTDIIMLLKKHKQVEDNRSEEDLYEDAVQVIKDNRKVSTSFLQRALGIGYSRAARIIELLEQKGDIGPADGSEPRKIFIKED